MTQHNDFTDLTGQVQTIPQETVHLKPPVKRPEEEKLTEEQKRLIKPEGKIPYQHQEDKPAVKLEMVQPEVSIKVNTARPQTSAPAGTSAASALTGKVTERPTGTSAAAALTASQPKPAAAVKPQPAVSSEAKTAGSETPKAQPAKPVPTQSKPSPAQQTKPAAGQTSKSQPQAARQYRNPGVVEQKPDGKNAAPSVQKTAQPAAPVRKPEAQQPLRLPRDPLLEKLAADVQTGSRPAADPAKRKLDPLYGNSRPPVKPVETVTAREKSPAVSQPLTAVSQQKKPAVKPAVKPAAKPAEKKEKSGLRWYLKLALTVDVIILLLAAALYLPVSPLRKNLIIGSLSNRGRRYIAYALYTPEMIQETIDQYVNSRK
ncbi:MAG: hypothetical protein J5887_03800 [Erysipelotrichaceae bacterium]|nr:hypothetical protein [Erysipelotrichaceae bacterium]